MKFQKLTFIASLSLTIVLSFFALVFDYINDFHTFDKGFYFTYLFCLIIVFLVNYLVLDLLFNFYGKKQIQRISTILPNEITENDDQITFEKLGERVTELNQKNVSELDMMKEMEVYRKEYIGNVSHELKTPLFSIQGYIETLREGGVEDLNIRDKYLERIDKSVERLLDIVKDLDMINQYESGEISLQYANFDINILIKEIFDLLDLEAQKLNAKFILQTSQNQLFVRADKQKISQVLLNLISNAVHYSNRDDAKITVNINALKNKVLIEIIDNGMGIKPTALPRIFERFYRVETSRNRKDGGSGLGLAIVKHILEAHRENIFVESVYLEGAKFSFQLDKAI